MAKRINGSAMYLLDNMAFVSDTPGSSMNKNTASEIDKDVVMIFIKTSSCPN